MEELIVIVCIVIFAIVVKLDNKRKFKRCKRVGDIGENIVASKLKQLSDNFVVKNNVHIGNCQIDHLVICHELKLVFVIETKMWGGVISGGHRDKKWRQDKGNVVNYYDNPIKQNQYHCREVKKYYKGYRVINVVVFINNKNVPKSECIISSGELVNYIQWVYNRVYNRCIVDV